MASKSNLDLQGDENCGSASMLWDLVFLCLGFTGVRSTELFDTDLEALVSDGFDADRNSERRDLHGGVEGRFRFDEATFGLELTITSEFIY